MSDQNRIHPELFLMILKAMGLLVPRKDFAILSPCFVETEVLNCESAIGAFDKDKVLVGAFS